jgi:hypothetical protein
MRRKMQLIPLAAAAAAACALAVPAANADTFTTAASLDGNCTPTGSSCKVLIPGFLLINIVTPPNPVTPPEPIKPFVITVFVMPGTGPAVVSKCTIPTDQGPNPLATCTTTF